MKWSYKDNQQSRAQDSYATEFLFFLINLFILIGG